MPSSSSFLVGSAQACSVRPTWMKARLYCHLSAGASARVASALRSGSCAAFASNTGGVLGTAPSCASWRPPAGALVRTELQAGRESATGVATGPPAEDIAIISFRPHGRSSACDRAGDVLCILAGVESAGSKPAAARLLPPWWLSEPVTVGDGLGGGLPATFAGAEEGVGASAGVARPPNGCCSSYRRGASAVWTYQDI